MTNSFFYAVLGGLGAMLFWGIADFLTKKAVDETDSRTVLFWVQAIGVIPLAIIWLVSSKSVLKLNDFPFIIVFSLIDTAGYIFSFKAFAKGKVSIVKPIISCYIFFAVIISVIFLGEKMVFGKTVIIITVLLGILLTIVDLENLKELFTKDNQNFEKGIPEALLSMVFFSFWFPFWGSWTAGRNLILISLIYRIFMVIWMTLVTKIGKVSLKVSNWQVKKRLLIIGILDTAAYLSITFGYSLSSSQSVVSVVASATSLPTIILARIFLKERLKPLQLIGIFVIILGIVLITAMKS